MNELIKKKIFFLTSITIDIAPAFKQFIELGNTVYSTSKSIEKTIETILKFNPDYFIVYNPTTKIHTLLSIIFRKPLYYFQADNPQNIKWNNIYHFSLKSYFTFTPYNESFKIKNFPERLIQLYKDTEILFNQLTSSDRKKLCKFVLLFEAKKKSDKLYDLVFIGNCRNVSEEDVFYLCEKFELNNDQHTKIIEYKNTILQDYTIFHQDIHERLNEILDKKTAEFIIIEFINLFSALRRTNFLIRFNELSKSYKIKIFGNDELLKIISPENYGGFLLTENTSEILSSSKIVVIMSSNFISMEGKEINYSFCDALPMGTFIDYNKYFKYFSKLNSNLPIFDINKFPFVRYKNFLDFKGLVAFYLKNDQERVEKINEIQSYIMDNILNRNVFFITNLLNMVNDHYLNNKEEIDRFHLDLLKNDNEALFLYETIINYFQSYPAFPDKERIIDEFKKIKENFFNLDFTGFTQEAINHKLSEISQHFRYEKKYYEALNVLALSKNPDLKIFSERGINYKYINDINNSLFNFVEALKISNSDPFIKFNYAKSLINFGKTEEGLIILKEIAQLEPSFKLINETIGLAYLSLSDQNQALEFFLREQGFNKYSFGAFYYAGLIYFFKDDYKKAEFNINRAIEIAIDSDNIKSAKILLISIFIEANKPLSETALLINNNELSEYDKNLGPFFNLVVNSLFNNPRKLKEILITSQSDIHPIIENYLTFTLLKKETKIKSLELVGEAIFSMFKPELTDLIDDILKQLKVDHINSKEPKN